VSPSAWITRPRRLSTPADEAGPAIASLIGVVVTIIGSLCGVRLTLRHGRKALRVTVFPVVVDVHAMDYCREREGSIGPDAAYFFGK
jgi:hypothetical protein